MAGGYGDRPAPPQTVDHTRMNQLVMHHQVAALWRSRKQGSVRGEAAAETECAFCTEITGGLQFQRLVLRMIPAQKCKRVAPALDEHGPAC